MANHSTDGNPVYFAFHGGETRWGTHVCCLYENDDQRDDLVLSFFAEGARTGDDLAYAAAGDTWLDLPERFKETVGYDYELYRLKARELCCFDGALPSWLIPEPCGQGELFASGGGLRTAADMGWLLEERPSASSCCQAELLLDSCVAERRWIALCLFDVRRFSSSELMLALKTHPYIYRGGLVGNQFYQGRSVVKGAFGQTRHGEPDGRHENPGSHDQRGGMGIA